MLADFEDRATLLALVYTLTESVALTRGTNVELILDESAGVLDGTTYYRPYYTAAYELRMSPTVQKLASGKGAEFTRMVTPIQAMLKLQLQLDDKYGWEVPGEFIVTQSDFILPADECECDNPAGILSLSALGTTRVELESSI